MPRLLHAVEAAWRSLAADLMAKDAAVAVAQAEVAARREVEDLAFRILSGQPCSDPALATGLPHIIQAEAPPAEILETLHQHLLSRQLHRLPDGRLQCRLDRGHRRSQGIYYTPGYIADYLARRCLADWIQPVPPRILDPACGCGRFLLSAARHLLRCGHPADQIARFLHGCDLDGEAVLVARRILTLGLAPHAAGPAQRHQIAASLQQNLVCGNALSDRFRQADSPSAAGPSGRERTPPSDSPPSPSSSPPSFDIILGNPPYRRELGTKSLLDQIAQTDFGRRYRAPRMDLWYYFLHRGIELLATPGRLGFIVGAYWAAGAGANRLIATLRQAVHVEEIFQLDRLRVFPQVAGHHMLLVVSKPASTSPTTVRIPLVDNGTDARPYVDGRAMVHTFIKTSDQLFRQNLLDLEPPAEDLLEKLSHFPSLGQLGKIRQGIAENPAGVTKAVNARHGDRWQIGEGVFALTPAELERLELPPEERQLVRPYHDLCDLARYERAEDPSSRLIYSTRETWPQLDDFPILAAHLARFRPIMEARRETRQGTRPWWQLHWPREPQLWEQPKLIALQMAQRPSFVPAQEPTCTSFSTNVFLPHAEVREHLNYLAALLNSRLLWKWFRHHAKRRGVGLEINGHVLARAPIRRIDFTSPEETAIHDRLVGLVDRMLDLSRRRRTTARAEMETEGRQTDAEIDRIVYRLYGLADEEIATVEAACQTQPP